MALDATLGGTSSNSYVTQADATAYLTDRLNAASLATWSALASGDKDAALIAATLRLDVEHYAGAPVTSTQRLKWPRVGAYTADDLLLDSSTIPRLITDAQCEMAWAIAQNPAFLEESGLEGFQHVKVGSLDVTPRFLAAAQLPSIVKQLIAPVRRGGFGVHVSRA